MRILILSDIHANWPALEAVLNEAQKIGFDQIWCAGDIVGYYPWCNEVTQWVRENVQRCVMGNHDAIIAGLISPDYFSSWAYRAIVWTLQELSEENKKFISNLPLVLKSGDTILVHDTPLRPLSMEYILYPEEALEVLKNTPQRFTFYGHTHIPILFELGEGELKVVYQMDGYTLRGDRKYLINPGSVGQPRDGIPLASFLIWDTERNLLFHKRVDFDKEKVIRELKKRNLPEELGYRLLKGV
jgi:diadenosine tetraphosphatase ApaH/serine/threonine PP2A family protein phosphatase